MRSPFDDRPVQEKPISIPLLRSKVSFPTLVRQKLFLSVVVLSFLFVIKMMLDFRDNDCWN